MGKVAHKGGDGKCTLQRLLEPSIDILLKVILVSRPNVGKSTGK